MFEILHRMNPKMAKKFWLNVVMIIVIILISILVARVS